MIDADLFQARELLAGLCAEFPERDDYQLAYATCQRHLLLHFVTTNRMSEAAGAFEKARTALTELRDQKPNDPKVLLELADTLSTASARLTGLDAAESEHYLRESTTTCQKLCESFPTVPEYQALLATCEDRVGMLEQTKRNWSEAEEAYQTAINRLERLRERFPNDRFYQLSFLQTVTHLAELCLIPEASTSGDRERSEVRELLAKAIEAYQGDRVSKSALERAKRALRALN